MADPDINQTLLGKNSVSAGLRLHYSSLLVKENLMLETSTRGHNIRKELIVWSTTCKQNSPRIMYFSFKEYVVYYY
jgi:hypothetical protein